MSNNTPYKLQLSKGANFATLEIDDISNITITDPNIKLAGVVNVNDLYTLPITSPASGNYILNSNNGALSFTTYTPTSVSQFEYNFYVSTSGNDSNDGSISSPYKTIGACMTFVNTLSADIFKSINLASGTYAENVSITKSGIALIGTNAITTIISGDITVNTTQNSSFYAVTVLENIQVNGSISQTNATVYNNTLAINKLISISPPTKNNLILLTSGLGQLADCTLNDSVIYVNNDTTGIIVNNSALFMFSTQVQNNPVLPNTTQNYISVLGAGRLNMTRNCLLENKSNSSAVKALIDIGNTSNAISSTSINNSNFIFTASTSTTTGAIINFSNTANSNVVNFYNNYCKCNVSVGSPQGYIVLKSSTGAVNFTFGNNLGTPSNHTIFNTGVITGWTRTLMDPIV